MDVAARYVTLFTLATTQLASISTLFLTLTLIIHAIVFKINQNSCLNCIVIRKKYNVHSPLHKIWMSQRCVLIWFQVFSAIDCRYQVTFFHNRLFHLIRVCWIIQFSHSEAMYFYCLVLIPTFLGCGLINQWRCIAHWDNFSSHAVARHSIYFTFLYEFGATNVTLRLVVKCTTCELFCNGCVPV